MMYTGVLFLFKAVTAEGNLTQASLAAKLKDAQDSKHSLSS